MTWSKLPIKTKLILLTFITSVFGILILSASLIWYENLTYRQQISQELNVIGNMLADRSNAALVFGDVSQLKDNINSLKLRESITLGCIYNEKNQVLATFSRSGKLGCPDKPRSTSGVFEDDHFYTVQDIMLDGEVIGRLYIESTLEELRRHLQNYVATATIVSALAVLGLLIISAILQRTVTTPLLHLSETATRIANDKNYRLRAELESFDEIGELTKSFNAMLETIEYQNKEILKSYGSLERQVEIRTAELKAANQELEAFSYSVSHDLRQPLRAIDGYSEAIAEDCSEKLDELAVEYLGRIRSASGRMSMLIDSMLTLSRVTRHKLDCEEVDLSQIVEGIASELRSAHPNRDVTMTIAPNVKAKGDERLLHIALSNLVENAWKYSSKKESAHIEFGVINKREGAVYFVKDDGAGFDMKYADRLFVAFNRLHTPSEFEGSGIGLATVFRIITRHRGRIWAESEPSRGSTFYFTLNVQ
ncbi:HAMP domain-containing histidine kinase [Hahella ganghwensis]|uniref:HAMP domain-containing histidine kinase n=1 Tax=Hahella ganghwensis TaxID=286420 RepID=UPI00037FEA95|nr:HAMP domain-containing histidine kinase [Hahella ganghwensis]